MLHPWRWVALWALAFSATLAPSHADGNIGCLFSPSLCAKGAEWCFDDYAFGKCISAFNEEFDPNSVTRYDMSEDQLQWFEGELQQLVTQGYRWDHAYTQCMLQAMLYAVQQEADPSEVDPNICDQFSDPMLEDPGPDSGLYDITPDETAFIRYTPNSKSKGSEFGNEIYNPPDIEGRIAPELPLEESGEPQASLDEIRDIILSSEDTEVPVLPFSGFRERINAERQPKLHDPPQVLTEKDKKSLPPKELTDDEKISELIDEERLGAHYRKVKVKHPPYTAEYITQNRFSPLDAEYKAKVREKYKHNFAAKNFPFEYENPDDIPEQRIYFEEDDVDIPFDSGSGEIEAFYNRDGSAENVYPPNLQYVRDVWNSIQSKLGPNEKLYAEGGLMKADDFKGNNEKYYSEDLNGLFANEFGFKRRERVDVKKPGPLPSIKAQHLRIQDDAADNEPSLKRGQGDESKEQPKEVAVDNTVTYVTFKTNFASEGDTGRKLMDKIEHVLGFKPDTFTNARFDDNEISFKVGDNPKGYNATTVAKKIDDMRNILQARTGAMIVATGIGDKVKHPVAVHSGFQEIQVFGIDLPVLLALFGSLCILIVGSFAFYLVLKKDMKIRKVHGLSSAAEIDAEATRDYQELCRARMSGGKWSGQQTAAATHPADPAQRIATLAKEAEKSPSARSSTSSWTEEPALTNMDISTGHMVLAYMEDHLRNKDRLEQEWQALCAYEAEPSATTAALRPENTGKNRYSDVLPYDHSRVTLNSLSNHLGSDYINASTITDHDPRNPAYIAAAGPLAHTAADFWQMIWEQGSVVMVMLTRLTENDRQLCHRYWPDEGSDVYHIYEVHLVSEHIWCDDYLVRSFYLKNQRTGETRTVTQFHFLSWPENGVPSSTKALLEFRRKVNKSYRGRSCPIVVHCSDGAGRTGTYCLIDMVLNRMAKGAKEIDIAATLEHIRDQRTCTVATKQQFEFVLMAVAEEVHAILKALPAHLQQLQEKKEKEKEDEKDKEK